MRLLFILPMIGRRAGYRKVYLSVTVSFAPQFTKLYHFFHSFAILYLQISQINRIGSALTKRYRFWNHFSRAVKNFRRSAK